MGQVMKLRYKMLSIDIFNSSVLFLICQIFVCLIKSGISLHPGVSLEKKNTFRNVKYILGNVHR